MLSVSFALFQGAPAAPAPRFSLITDSCQWRSSPECAASSDLRRRLIGIAVGKQAQGVEDHKQGRAFMHRNCGTDAQSENGRGYEHCDDA